ncbi:hypothetical protein H9639_05040 [Arthrobacter sp. Sa2CUA1]|uniref:Helix-turn-helix domain-containing protein n=1 Tax=Arthrobacter gallicola TaxID=2762225 RepID=A0ABR8UQ11_9MICC|nr:hypothetical protein [Arthrobacter gallicola]MBD7994658.1 hypothetical protein [Arthrobacter gallicola]
MPGLDLLLPLPVSGVRLSRMALPGAALALWIAVLCAVLVLLGAGDPALITLRALAGVGFGATAVRGAYRVQPDWSLHPRRRRSVQCPAQAGSMVRGFDTTLLPVGSAAARTVPGVCAWDAAARAGWFFCGVCSCADVFETEVTLYDSLMPQAASTDAERFLGSPRWAHMTEWMSTSEIGEARPEWRLRCSQRYQRQPGEYPQVGTPLLLVSWEQAESIEPYDDRPFDEIVGLWMPVVGTEYEPPRKNQERSGTIYKADFELVPEPGNPYDHTALAVDLNGVRIGYLGASYAAHHHWRVRALNVLGHRVVVPGFYRSTFSPIAERDCLEAFALRPTTQMYDGILEDQEEQASRINELWAALSNETRERIACGGFHLTDETAGEVLKLQERFPDIGLPTLPYADAMPRSIQLMLRNARHEQAESKWRKARELDAKALDLVRGGSSVRNASREIAISETRIRKAMKEAGVTALRKHADESRDQTVVLLAEKGLSLSAISAEAGLSVRAVSAALRRRDVPTRGVSGVNEWSRASMLQRVSDCADALKLQGQGNTREEIAKQMGVSVHTVKKRLSDGHFFDNPANNPQRLDLARRVREQSLKQSECSGFGEQRALTDGNVLDLIHAGWMHRA